MISAFADFDANPRTTASSGFEAAQRRGALDKRIVQLESDFYADHGGPLLESSVAGLKSLMRYIPRLPQPSLGAESSGCIVATWESAAGCLSLRFVDSTHFHYAMSSNGQGGRRERAWGNGEVLTFFAVHPEAQVIAMG